MGRKVVITIENTEHDYSILLDYFKKHGIIAEWKPMSGNTPSKTIERVKGYDAVLAGGDIFNSDVLETIKESVKIIARFGTGYDRIDIGKASELGIVVTNTPGKMSEPVADMTVLLMLGIARRITAFDNRTKNGEWWQDYIGTQLEGKKVGLIGFGNIARKVSKYLRGFSCEIIAFDKYFDKEAAEELYVKFATVDEIARQSDYISLHIPLNNETKHMINKDFFDKMRSTAYIINTSRGAVIDEEALAEALLNNRIAGAALDVFEKEPLRSENPLLKLDNVFEAI